MGRKNNRKKEHIPSIKRLERLLVYPRRMEIWHANLPMNQNTSVQGGSRPVVIISNDICNQKSNIVTVAPITSRMKHLEMPTHVVIGNLREENSMVLAEQIQTIDKSLLDKRIGSCAGMEDQIEAAILEQIGIKQAAEAAERKNE